MHVIIDQSVYKEQKPYCCEGRAKLHWSNTATDMHTSDTQVKNHDSDWWIITCARNM